MINEYLQYIQESYKPNDISLGEFDKSYWNSLSKKDRDKIYFDDKVGKYFIIKNKNDNCGIVGLIIKNRYFFQIILESKCRGKNLVKISSDLIMEKFKLKKLYATIDKSNIASLKGHEKAGFKRNFKEEKELKSKNRMIDNKILLTKMR